MDVPFTNTDVFALLAAIPLAALGGEAFLKGVLGMARCLRLPEFLVATTLVAFATSSPELTVSSMAALADKPEIGLGNALGSNVVNLALILGLALLFGSLSANFVEIRRDFLLALCVPALTLILVLDGVLSGTDAALLLGLFAAWLGLTIRQGILHRRANLAPPGKPEPTNNTSSPRPMRAALLLTIGLGGLILAGRLFVTGAAGIAETLGIQAYLIGALVVAIGTTLPELVTTLIARWRGHDEVGLGTLLGSNLFNGLAIVGVAAAIHPIQAPIGEVAIALGFGLLSVLLLFPRGGLTQHGLLSRWRGILLLSLYVAYIAISLILQGRA